MPAIPVSLLPFVPVLLLAASNIFMTVAWYGHLKFPNASLYAVIFASWGIALVEYCFAVPANRIGHRVYSLAELKTIQEVLTLIAFAGFSTLVMGERLTIQHGAGFVLILAGAALVFTAGGKTH